ncbi:MAG: hypothetical protein KAV87_19585 [Desulfobacteraceae bacterium]|nr:hypothetical protein [Desulfobacteraceae bacterium]
MNIRELSVTGIAIAVLLLNIQTSAAYDPGEQESCGIINMIWEYGEKLPDGKKAKLLEVYRNRRPIKAVNAMPIYEKDRIQAMDYNVEFEIKWYPSTDTAENDRSLFKPAQDIYEGHILIEECREEARTIFNHLGEVWTFIRSGKLFNIRTKPAYAAASGTTFRAKLKEKGEILKVLVTDGQVILKNKYAAIEIGPFEEGTATQDKPPIKESISKEYIQNEVDWMRRVKELPQFYKDQLQNVIRFSSLRHTQISTKTSKMDFDQTLSDRSIKYDKSELAQKFKELKSQHEDHARRFNEFAPRSKTSQSYGKHPSSWPNTESQNKSQDFNLPLKPWHNENQQLNDSHPDSNQTSFGDSRLESEYQSFNNRLQSWHNGVQEWNEAFQSHQPAFQTQDRSHMREWQNQVEQWQSHHQKWSNQVHQWNQHQQYQNQSQQWQQPNLQHQFQTLPKTPGVP